MDSRRLVVWISTGILGFQGATLAFDLLNCTALSWLYVRANGLAASYVSGYLATDPPPGKERMFGVDATHAWAAVWTPGDRWIGLDPTNDQFIDERYITVGWGRDYADVPPLRGIIYTDSEYSVIDVSVDVAPFDPDGPGA
jgi:transglutaminase-like putative cysteine protease